MKKNLISINDLERSDIESFLSTASEVEKLTKRKASDILPGCILSTLFLEPSTRTRLSFEAAMQRLGGTTINLASEVSSVQKGENITDTGKVVAGYTDICVVRSPYEGTARMLTEKTKVPIINGGDGANQHPTQTLLDLFTIKKEFGSIDGLKIGMMGDLKYGRTVHSLAEALDNYSVEIRLISPDETKMPEHIVKEVGVEEETNKMKIKDLDVLYTTRIQKERFPDKQEYERVKDVFVLDEERVKEMKKDAILMHPLPRIDEIKPEGDKLPQARYFEQAKNGVPARMGIILELLGVEVNV